MRPPEIHTPIQSYNTGVALAKSPNNEHVSVTYLAERWVKKVLGPCRASLKVKYNGVSNSVLLDCWLE
jgi:hypothetical protein